MWLGAQFEITFSAKPEFKKHMRSFSRVGSRVEDEVVCMRILPQARMFECLVPS